MSDFSKLVEVIHNDGITKAYFLLVILKNGKVGCMKLSGDVPGEMVNMKGTNYVQILDELRLIYKEARLISSGYGKY